MVENSNVLLSNYPSEELGRSRETSSRRLARNSVLFLLRCNTRETFTTISDLLVQRNIHIHTNRRRVRRLFIVQKKAGHFFRSFFSLRLNQFGKMQKTHKFRKPECYSCLRSCFLGASSCLLATNSLLQFYGVAIPVGLSDRVWRSTTKWGKIVDKTC